MTTASEPGGCFFCEALEADDQDAGVLQRSEQVFVMLNAYPYNTGHLMIAPVRHVGDPAELSPEESHALIDESFRCVEVLRAAMGPDGFNLGMNLGRVAGAGVPGHLHVHVVPRWGGDTNFMPVVGQTKVMPELLTETRDKLAPLFARSSP